MEENKTILQHNVHDPKVLLPGTHEVFQSNSFDGYELDGGAWRFKKHEKGTNL